MKTITIGLFFVLSIFTCCAGFAQSGQVSMNDTTKKQLVDSIVQCLQRNYVYADTARRMAVFLEKAFKDGAYKEVTDPQKFAVRITQDLRSVYNDVHLSVTYNPDQAAYAGDDSPAAQKKGAEAFSLFSRKSNFGFKKAEILPGNIGYLSMDRFFDVSAESKATVNAVFSMLRNADALIIDLRNNGGGSPYMISLVCSYFFKDKTHVDDSYERRKQQMTAYWTTPVEGFSALDSIPVYILVNHRTFSAAEAFSYDLQNLRRATVIGEVTGGGAHQVSGNSVGHGFFANVPFARAINPVSKTNWEKIGVKPDIKVNADSALDVAIFTYYSFILEHSKDPGELHSISWSRDMLQARLHPLSLDTALLASYVGTYEKRKVKLENGSLFYYGTDGIRIRLLALSDTVMRLENSEDIKITFHKNSSGATDEMTFIFSDGYKGAYPKKE